MNADRLETAQLDIEYQVDEEMAMVERHFLNSVGNHVVLLGLVMVIVRDENIVLNYESLHAEVIHTALGYLQLLRLKRHVDNIALIK